jgi:hypothetical protein
MAKGAGNRPAEIFGYPIDNHSAEARQIREKHRCPFMNTGCGKNSRLIDYPFGVCSVQYRGQINAVCPHRLKEQGTLEGIPRVLEEVASHYFGDFNNVIPFREVKLLNVGAIDYVLVRHKPMKAEIEDFVAVELQTDSTTQTGQVVQGLRDFVAGENVASQMYRFGMNTYDTIKRSMTQLSNKGIVYEAWGTKGYWVFQDYIYQNLVKRMDSSMKVIRLNMLCASLSTILRHRVRVLYLSAGVSFRRQWTKSTRPCATIRVCRTRMNSWSH